MGKSLKYRAMEVQSYVYDLYGKPIFTPDMIMSFINKNSIENGGTLLRWCWTVHDKDVYTKDEEVASAMANNGTPTVICGSQKPVHIHLALEWQNQVYLSAVAKAFSLPERQVQKPLSRYNQFMNMCIYQTHEKPEEQAKGKYRYFDNEVHCNFAFRAEADRILKVVARATARKFKKAEVQEIIEDVERGAITPEEIRKKYGYAFYQDYQKKIDTARQEYIRRYYMPSLRINFYVDAKGVTHGGRIGKTQLCKMLARSLFPQLLDSECFFEVGSSRAGLQAYKEQPVIIWNDMRAVDMVQVFGRQELLNMLDDHPGKTESRVLYGTVIPVQKFNIINGIEPYDDFLKGLAGTYKDRYGNEVKAEDESQVFGRFPFIIHVSTDWIDFMISRGWMNGTREFEMYDRFARSIGGIKKLMTGYDGQARNYLGYETAKSVIDKVRYIENRDSTTKITRVEDINPDDVPFTLTAPQAEELEHRLYNKYLENQTARGMDCNKNMDFKEWCDKGGNMSGIWVGNKKDGGCRNFTSDEIKAVCMEILSETRGEEL